MLGKILFTAEQYLYYATLLFIFIYLFIEDILQGWPNQQDAVFHWGPIIIYS